MNTVKTILSISNLNAGYNGSPVLKDISIELHEGEILGIIGQNGCGKSTLLKAIYCLTPQSSGIITFAGTDITRENTSGLLKSGISYFMQGGLVFPRLTVKEHLELAMEHLPKQEQKKIADEVFTRFPELQENKNKIAGNLSGGQRQILSFGMLLASHTKVWLLDEPTAGLAPEMVQFSVNFIKEMREKRNISVILAEHNYDAAFQMMDNVVVMKDGSVSSKYTKEEFTKRDFLDNNLYN